MYNVKPICQYYRTGAIAQNKLLLKYRLIGQFYTKTFRNQCSFHESVFEII